MNNFNYQRQTELIFGQNQLDQLASKIKLHGSRVLLTYGMNSIKTTGLYDQVVTLLKQNDIYFVELAKIKPNPEVDTVIKGVDLINQHQLDFILAVGGGSVIDNSKHMAMAQAAGIDPWKLLKNPELHSKSNNLIKLGTILTICATGSEMNAGGVLTNPQTQEKLPMFHPDAVPVFSFLDPLLLKTLPPKQRIAGVCDTISHLLEVYFDNHQDSGFADRMIEGLLVNTIAYSQSYIDDVNDYEAACQMMINATYALNGVTGLGKAQADWKTHSLEHELSAQYDFTHGIGLAMIHPHMLELYYQKDLVAGADGVKFVNLGKNVFKLTGSDQQIALQAVEQVKLLMFGLVGKTQLSEYGITDFPCAKTAQTLIEQKRVSPSYHQLTDAEITSIYQKIC